METGEKKFEELIKILAYFASQKNYGYIDRLSNALNEVAAYEAIKDAIRDYYSACVDRRGECCPDIGLESLENEIRAFKDLISGKSGDIIVKETMGIVLEALARKAVIKCKAEEKTG